MAYKIKEFAFSFTLCFTVKKKERKFSFLTDDTPETGRRRNQAKRLNKSSILGIILLMIKSFLEIIDILK